MSPLTDDNDDDKQPKIKKNFFIFIFFKQFFINIHLIVVVVVLLSYIVCELLVVVYSVCIRGLVGEWVLFFVVVRKEGKISIKMNEKEKKNFRKYKKI